MKDIKYVKLSDIKYTEGRYQHPRDAHYERVKAITGQLGAFRDVYLKNKEAL